MQIQRQNTQNSNEVKCYFSEYCSKYCNEKRNIILAFTQNFPSFIKKEHISL